MSAAASHHAILGGTASAEAQAERRALLAYAIQSHDQRWRANQAAPAHARTSGPARACGKDLTQPGSATILQAF